MEYTFRRATAQDVDGIMEIIRDRIEWMDREGLYQWNKTNYMQRYPREYFLEGINRGEFYLAISPEQEVSGVIAMLTVDPRWENDELKDCYYLHHLAAKPQAKGAGRALLNFCEELSRKEGKECIRLDCQYPGLRFVPLHPPLAFGSVLVWKIWVRVCVLRLVPCTAP
mgnify:CR=1 FL=1